jgi:hypothetical protein
LGDERGIDANDPIGDLIRVVKALLPITTMVLSVGRAAAAMAGLSRMVNATTCSS